MEEALCTSMSRGGYNTAELPSGLTDVLFESRTIQGGEMGQRIFAFRHAKSVKNDPETVCRVLRDGVTDRDMDLSERGWGEATLLEDLAGRYLVGRGLVGKARIIYSPYRRAKITAGVLHESLLGQEDVEVVATMPDERLRDHDSGEVLGLSHEEAREKYSEYAEAMDASPYAYLDAVPPGGENKRATIARVDEFRKSLTSYSEHIVLVTHFDIIAALVALTELDHHGDQEQFDKQMLGMLSSAELWDSTGSITEFEREGDGSLSLVESFHKLW